MDTNTKRCVSCDRHLPVGEFNRQRAAPDGLQKYCRLCQREKAQAYYWANPDKYRAKVALWRSLHPEEVKQHRLTVMDKYRADSDYRRKINALNCARAKRMSQERRMAIYQRYRDDKIAYATRWNRENSEKRREICRRREARKRLTTVARVDYAAIWERDRGICYLCGLPVARENLHFDHIIPLARGGFHTDENIAVTHSWCNLRKGAKMPTQAE